MDEYFATMPVTNATSVGGVTRAETERQRTTASKLMALGLFVSRERDCAARAHSVALQKSFFEFEAGHFARMLAAQTV
jgi:hypothetical protein